MSSERLALVLAALCACADNTVVVDVPARATFDVRLGPTDYEPLADETTYRWDVVEVPAASHVEALGGGAVVTFRPDIRGVYVVERWLVYGLSDRLTHRFVVEADGIPPVAVATSSVTATVGSPVQLSAVGSTSAEGRDLSYRWRLTQRPRDSAAALNATDEISASLAPDIAGTYGIELAVFDGELWSTTPATLQIEASP